MRLSEVIDSFPTKKILVIGDIILDRYLWGKVSRISPEAPVPVVDVVSDSYMLGGAANVANNIVSLGGSATVLGIVGKDRGAEVTRSLLKKHLIESSLIEDARPTSVKTRVIAHGQQVVRFDLENREQLSGRALKGMLQSLSVLVSSHDAVIISDYKKGIVTAELMKALLSCTRGKKRKFVAVDPKVGHFHLYKGVSLITPNTKEAGEGAAIEIRDQKTLLKAGLKLLKSLNSQAVLITRGEEGMSLFMKSGVTDIPTVARKVFDVTGAGDTVIASFTLAHACGASMEEAAILSNHAAGIVVAEVGTATATSDKLRKSIKIK